MPKTMIAQRSTRTKVAFGDVVQLSRERSSDPERDGHERFIGLEHIDPGDLRLRRWGNVADGVTFTSVFRPGQVLFGKRRAYQRKVAVADFSGVCSGDIYVLEPKSDLLLPEMLPFICQTEAFFEHAVGTSAGSLSPRTNWESLASFEFTLPPIEEQRAFVGVVSKIDRVLDSYTTAVDVMRVTLESLAERCFARQSGRRESPLRVMVSKLGSGKTPTGGETVYSSEGVIFLRSQNVHSDGLRLDDAAYISEEIDESMASTRVAVGDVLLNITGASIGRCAVFDREERANVNQHVCILRPKREIVDSWFLAFFIQSRFGQAKINAFATNGNRQGINFQQIGGISLPDTPLAIQVAIGQAFQRFIQQRCRMNERAALATAIRRCALAELIS